MFEIYRGLEIKRSIFVSTDDDLIAECHMERKQTTIQDPIIFKPSPMDVNAFQCQTLFGIILLPMTI